MARVFITRKMPEEWFDGLTKEGHTLRFHTDAAISKEELLEGARSADALCTMVNDPVDSEVILTNPELKIISNYAVGFNNIDLKAATSRKLPVTNTPDVLTDATAEHAVALLLALVRKVVAADGFTRSGKFTEWSPTLFLGSQLRGKTLGIVGMGRIGKRVAEILVQGFGMRVLYSGRKAVSGCTEPEYCFTPLDRLLKESDVVSLHCPLTPETQHLLTREKLLLLKKEAYLVNTARGPVVDEGALVEILKVGRIAGAALDVFEDEPRLHSGLAGCENVVLTPHVGSGTHEARKLMANMVSKNILAALGGEQAPNVVNTEIY